MRTPATFSEPSRGFTLIELLIVIVIIAVLAALTLAVLSRGGEAGKRAACLSNLRAVHTAATRFAADNNGALPIGYRLGKKQFNTTLYSGSSNKWVLLGVLLEARLIDDPRILFCPSETDPTQAFNTPQNPYPIKSGTNLQGGYACNPLVDWGTATTPPDWPRLQSLDRVPMLADGAGLPERVDSRHRDGIHVIYTDGSARWVPRKDFEAQLSQSTSLGAESNDAQTKLWEILAEKRTP